jgi:lysophospholipid acyltransferase (LPLAT)-like uncharacterized protein
VKPPMGLVAWAGAGVIRVLGATWRIRFEDEEQLLAARRVAPNVIFAFWHGRLLPLLYTHRGQPVTILASEHRDGEMLGRTIVRFGYGHARGSSTRGGTRALLDLAQRIRSGLDVALTVDGPRGPRHVVKPGAIEIAKLTGAAIVPVTAASRRHRTLSSWDAFEVPAPGTRVVVRYAAPVLVPAGADRDTLEARRVELERTLIRITEEADRGALA